jgi:O-antigen ligase
MLARYFDLDLKKPIVLFCIGWATVMLTLWVLLLPEWRTFIHMWRVEIYASIFLLGTLAFLIYRYRDNAQEFRISRDEIKYIVVPISAFILWSAASMLWAPSWKSAMHHTVVWCEYLIFYMVVRQILESGDGYRKLVTALSFTLILFGLSAVSEYCSFLIFGGGTNVGINNAKYGEQVNAILPLLMIGVVRLRGKQFVLGLFVIAALWLLVFCSMSRTNLLLFAGATIGVCGTIFIFKRFHRYRRKLATVLLTLVLAPLPLQLFSILSDDPGVPIYRRLNDEQSISSSNNFRKLMAGISVEMIRANPLTGVGADNFGFQLNNYRALFSAADPTNLNLAEAEDQIPERAHNEFLQIIAELGVVGGLICLWFLTAVPVMALRAVRNRTHPFAIAAVLGLIAFLASSLVSSYSFRLIQNGFVFLFVLAIAAKLLLKPKLAKESIDIAPVRLKFALAVGILPCLILMGYCVIRVSSIVAMRSANAKVGLEDARPLYDLAMLLDDENPEAPRALGFRLFDEHRYAEAIPHITAAIQKGSATSAHFSYLATAQLLAGDHPGAEATFRQALTLYPRSTFVLTRYARILRDNGKYDESDEQLGHAIEINKRSANTWWLMINEGPRAASEQAVIDENFRPVMDLTPTAAIYALNTERQIRFPNERTNFAGL